MHMDEIIEDLVASYERLSDNVCSETGVWYENKIVLGGWIYDVCLDAFNKLYIGEKSLELAEECVNRSQKITRAKRLMMYLNSVEADYILKYVEERASK